MDLKGYGHVYECYPPLWFNDKSEVCVKLKCVPKKDFDVQVEVESTYGMTEKRNKGHEFIAKYVTSIEGLEVDGQPVTTFDQLKETGPTDLYTWIYTAVLSQERLTKAEVKN
jgi:hypothetical protein